MDSATIVARSDTSRPEHVSTRLSYRLAFRGGGTPALLGILPAVSPLAHRAGLFIPRASIRADVIRPMLARIFRAVTGDAIAARCAGQDRQDESRIGVKWRVDMAIGIRESLIEIARHLEWYFTGPIVKSLE
ncbi:hypothetical protein [Burkholderia sp. NLJ2]|uniref:hypothetical protein n=1 Tax=Burkholderia sp. NLJ2 TaxID=3090699 RepID=UPI003C6C0C4E